MPGKGIIKRRQLFSFYSSNLSIYHPTVTDKFLCPVCLTLFTRDALSGDPPEVSLAHIIPKSLKGHLYTLVCRSCDNSIGSTYDRHSAIEKRLCDWNEGAASIAGRLRSKNENVAVECRRKGSTLEFRNIPKQSFPKSWEKFLKAASYDWRNFKFSLTVSAFNPNKLSKSILYSGFLMMFYQLGYEYVLSPNVSRIREVIQGTDLPENMHNAIYPLSKSSPDTPSTLPSVSILVEPENVRSFIVVLPSPRREEAARCVLLPGFGEDGENCYTNILNSVKPLGNFRAKLIPDYFKNHLIDTKYKWFANWLWKNFA